MYNRRWGAFYRTPLERHLTKLGIDTLVLARISGSALDAVGRTDQVAARGRAAMGVPGRPHMPMRGDGLCWYPDEQTWQVIAHARMADGAQKTSLAVTYTTDYGINTNVVKAARGCGVSIGGKFEEQRDTIWRLDAEFPSISN